MFSGGLSAAVMGDPRTALVHAAGLFDPSGNQSECPIALLRAKLEDSVAYIRDQAHGASAVPSVRVNSIYIIIILIFVVLFFFV